MNKKEIQLLPNTSYHIYNHANGKENLFNNVDNYLSFLNRYEKYIAPIAETFAYCLMPNHFHSLVRIKDVIDLKSANKKAQKRNKITPKNYQELTDENIPLFLSNTYSNFFNSYTQSFNYNNKRKGNLFIQNFKRKEVTTDDYFLKLISYIHNNPVKDGFVSDLEDWEFSSYHSFIKITTKDKVMNAYGGFENFLSYHKNYKEKINLIKI